MFDKYFCATQTVREHVPYEKTVIEKRAPTDESIKIYDEMRDKARESVIDTIDLRNNDFDVKATVFEDHIERRMVCKYIFYVNNKKVIGEVSTPHHYSYNAEDFIRLIYEDASKTLCKLLMEALYRAPCVNKLCEGMK